MTDIFKLPLIFFGGIFIGFGVGIIVGGFLISNGANYWLLIIISLIFGGFLSALGLMTKKQPEEKMTEKGEDYNLQNPANS